MTLKQSHAAFGAFLVACIPAAGALVEYVQIRKMERDAAWIGGVDPEAPQPAPPPPTPPAPVAAVLDEEASPAGWEASPLVGGDGVFASEEAAPAGPDGLAAGAPEWALCDVCHANLYGPPAVEDCPRLHQVDAD